MSSLSIDGKCDAAFADVREVFARNFADGLELGARVAVVLDGVVVVDLWGGYADPGRGVPWSASTLVNVWSSTKGVVALAAHLLADRGLLDLDAPVARYWPEFAAGGKAELPVRYLLNHRAGLAGLPEPFSAEELYDWGAMTSRLAAAEPLWEPGTVSGYHAMTYGHLVGEVIRRISGRTVGEFIRDELAGPLDADFHIGLAPAEDGRVATLVQAPPPPGSELEELFAKLSPIALAALAGPGAGPEIANTPQWRRAEIPAANGHATALALAQLYGAYAGRSAVLSARQADLARQGQGRCLDLVIGAPLGRESEFGLGVILSGEEGNYGPNPRAFGFDGYGGSFGMCDPEAGMSMGYTMNVMGHHVLNDPRKTGLIDAVYAAL
ncbi:serine hydrolase domain-containing protein [Streptomyces sp. NPDC050610]|uniref:serine hydrolase domain-containing protein n=1 Tax=Streptomyces sp. NPDC050610 TaxID=3157097 RepID=UPI003413C8A2